MSRQMDHRHQHPSRTYWLKLDGPEDLAIILLWKLPHLLHPVTQRPIVVVARIIQLGLGFFATIRRWRHRREQGSLRRTWSSPRLDTDEELTRPLVPAILCLCGEGQTLW